jgi:hypothetical protein
MATLKQDAKRAAQLLDSQELAGWDLAELCARRVLSSNHPSDVELQRELGRVSAAEWAEMVTSSGRRRLATSTAQKYARCWRRYGEKAKRLHDETGAERSFAEHYAAASAAEDQAEQSIARSQERDQERGWGGRQGQAQQTVAEQAQQLPAEHKAAVARQMLEDPDVAVRVLRDRHTAANVSKARERVWEENVGAAKDREQASPVQRDLARVALHFEIGNDLAHARFRTAEATRKLTDLTERPPDLAADAQAVKDALAWFDTVWNGGQVDDEALAKLLEGGAS